jgi:tRNA dimethylallyltransferase
MARDAAGGGEAPAPCVVALVGATATGKTELGEALAGSLGADIVCADSRQVFRELDVGTGKPDAAARARRPHHLFDWLALGETPSAGDWARAAAACLDEIHARDGRALLVGGSGLYLRALMHGLPRHPPRDPAVRERLRHELAERGAPALHARLAEVDPASARRLAPADRQRIVRALEVWETSGRPWSEWRMAPAEGFRATWRVIELTAETAELDRRIAARARHMFAHGLLEETAGLERAGLGPALEALSAVGYDEALAVLAGRMPRDAAIARTILRTRQLAKRQRTWFRHQVAATRLDSARPPDALLAAARAAAGHTQVTPPR